MEKSNRQRIKLLYF